MAATACEGGPTRSPVPGFSVVLAPSLPDTALAVLPGGLMVTLRDDALAPVAGAIIRFDALAPDSSLWTTSVYLTRDTTHFNWAGTSTDTTDADGHAWSALRLGCAVGLGRVRIRIPSAAVDTVLAFPIAPGAAVRLAIQPADTTILVGSSMRLRGGVVDQCFNRRPEPITVTADPYVIADSSLAVAGTAVGAARVVVTGLGETDTVRVLVLPRAALVAQSSASNGIVQANLDGAARTNTFLPYFPTVPPGGFSWGPAGAIAFHVSDSTNRQALFLLQGSGKPVRVPAIAPAVAYDRMMPRFSPDGAWLYYAQGTYNSGFGSMEIWRVHPDGTSASRLVPASNGSLDVWPSPSPNGVQLVFESNRGGTKSLWMTTIGSGTATLFRAGCGNPAFSPDGQYVACVDATPNLLLLLVNGSLLGTFSMTGAFGAQTPCWTPDSKWIMYASNGGLRLLNPVSRDTLTMTSATAFWRDCALRPAP